MQEIVRLHTGACFLFALWGLGTDKQSFVVIILNWLLGLLLKIYFLHNIVKITFVVVGQDSRIFFLVEHTLGFRRGHLLVLLDTLLGYVGT